MTEAAQESKRTFAIIRDAPPLPRTRRGRSGRYPFAELKVGDAFNVPRSGELDKLGRCRTRLSVASAAGGWAYRHNPDARFSTCILDRDTIRCRREQ